MAFTFKKNQPVGKTTRRLIRKQIGKAIDGVASVAATRPKQLHTIRTRLKRARAVLRLARDNLGDREFRYVNARCRDAARALSEVRDAQVVRDTLQTLGDHFAEQLRPAALEKVRRRLQALSKRRLAALHRASRFEACECALRRACEKARHLRLRRHGWRIIERGFHTTYSAARAGYRRTAKHPEAAAFHEWRKQSKYLRHQLELLQLAWPPALAAAVKGVHKLTDLLGDDHDLEILRALLRTDAIDRADRESVGLVRSLITLRQQELRAEARVLGRRLFAESPGAFTDRMHTYWKAWRQPRSRVVHANA